MYCLIHDGSAYQEVSCDTPDAYIVVTRVELAQMSPFVMSIESGAQIGGALLMVMTVAWLLRQARKSLDSE